MDVTEPKAKVVVFQTVDTSPALVRLGLSNRDNSLDQMELLQRVQIGCGAFKPGGQLDLV